MIFLGDIALPQGIIPKVDYLPGSFSQPVIANLEGAIALKDSVSVKEMKLFNDEKVIDFLTQLNVKVVSLGNNHITDVPSSFENTKKLLDENNIDYCGAGNNLSEARKPAILQEKGITYAFLSFGWSVISCKYASKNSLGVNPLEKDNMVECIINTKKQYPNAKIIILPHWNYELELYPQPMHRKLARIAIDAGADAIFGHHSHCVQGIEFYKDKPIVYGLGNWFIPDGIYFNGKLRFPSISKVQLAVEWNDSDLICHRFFYDWKKCSINYIDSFKAEESEYISSLTPFSDMSDKEYFQWFKKHRRKKKGLPIYRSYNEKLINRIKNYWIALRQDIIKTLLVAGIKKSPK